MSRKTYLMDVIASSSGMIVVFSSLIKRRRHSSFSIEGGRVTAGAGTVSIPVGNRELADPP